jgi:two-component system, chemotaxis family, protein-glutamate methylesterase/glutaminase
MANRDIVAIGTSAGGIEALLFLAKHFPPAFPAAILVTIHLPSHRLSSLDDLLTRAGPLPAAFAKHGDAVTQGRLFIAPPGRHLLIDGGALSLGVGPRENNVRPSIDPMLRSAALCCGSRTVGVVLTGTQGDGASGLWAVNQCGGSTVVQDPRDAAFPEMPLTALSRANPKHIAALADMPPLLERLVHQRAGEPLPCPLSLKYEVEIARSGRYSMREIDRIGRRSVLTCPDCNGVMWELDEGELIRYRCHVGHAYTGDKMSLALDDNNLRRALGSALRVLDERVALVEKLRKQAVQRGHTEVANTWATRKHEFEAEARVLRKAVERANEVEVADDAGVR